jgi:phosphoglycerol transferase MdoB-like AlkP superfamily enzyme
MTVATASAEGLTSLKVAPETWRRFAGWLFCWIVLPTLPFIVMWIYGGPPREDYIVLMAAVGLLVRRKSRIVQFPTWVLMFAIMCIAYVSAIFNLKIIDLLHSLRFLAELKPQASPEYTLVAAGIGLTLGGAFIATGLRQSFDQIVLLVLALALAFAMQGLDWQMTYAQRGSYKHTAPGATPHDSGLSHLDVAGAVAAKRNIVVVVVESLGLPVDPALRARILAPFKDSRIAARYDVAFGSSPYFGSTTSGEMRELCGRWDDYQAYTEMVDTGCLPARLARAGYETTAVHSFSGGFFKRHVWYPNIGFQTSIFGESLRARGVEQCPGVFAGACDRDVPRLLKKELLGKDQPQFLYFLTVNSHLPIPAYSGMRSDKCENYDAALQAKYPMICRLFAIYGGLSRELVKLFADPDLPPMDILVVGDHMPPFYDRRLRSEFDGERIPWIVLSHKSSPPAGRPAASAN